MAKNIIYIKYLKHFNILFLNPKFSSNKNHIIILLYFLLYYINCNNLFIETYIDIFELKYYRMGQGSCELYFYIHVEWNYYIINNSLGNILEAGTYVHYKNNIK